MQYILTIRLALIPTRTRIALTALSEYLTPHHTQHKINHAIRTPSIAHVQSMSPIPGISSLILKGVSTSFPVPTWLPKAAELLRIGSHGEMSRKGFVQGDGAGGVLRRTNDASLWPTRFQALNLFYFMIHF